MKYAFLLSFLCLILSSCGDTTKKTAPSTTQTAPPPPAANAELPAPPPEFAMDIFNNCDYVDIIMYKSNFSMNVSQKNSIQMLVQALTTESQPNFANCPAQGRLFFLNQGKSLTEAELHFTDGVCHAMVFYVDGKKKYSSKLGQQGINMFAGYFQQADKFQKEARGGQ